MENRKVDEPKIPCIDLISPSPRRPLLSPARNALDQPKANCIESREPAIAIWESRFDKSQKPVSKRVTIKRKHAESTSQIEKPATAAAIKDSKDHNPCNVTDKITEKSKTNPTINNLAIQLSSGSVDALKTKSVALNLATKQSNQVFEPNNLVTKPSNGSVAARDIDSVASNPVAKPSNGSVAARNTNAIACNPVAKPSNGLVAARNTNSVSKPSNGSIAARNTYPVLSNSVSKPSDGSVAARNSNLVHIIRGSAHLTSCINAAPVESQALKTSIKKCDQSKVTINPVVQSAHHTAVQSLVQTETISNPNDALYDVQQCRSNMSKIKRLEAAGRQFFSNTIKGRFFQDKKV